MSAVGHYPAVEVVQPRCLRRGIWERLTTQGEALIPLDEDQARAELEVLARCEVEAVAICLLNAYVDGRHERRLRELVPEVLGGLPCSISSEVSPLAKEYARASTTVVDVVMKQKYGDYSDGLVTGLASWASPASCPTPTLRAAAAGRRRDATAPPAGGRGPRRRHR
jgi:N-methylhydantoinase A